MNHTSDVASSPNATTDFSDDRSCCANFFTTCFSSWRLDCTKQMVAAITTVIFYLLVMLANSGIILYEKVVADTYRTLINKVVVLMSAYNMALSTWLLPMILMRQFCALEGLYCPLNVFISLTLMLQIFLVHNELAVLLHWSSWRLGSIQAINEDIGKTVLGILNTLLSVFFAMIMCMSFKEKIFIYKLCKVCSGTDDDDDKPPAIGTKVVLGLLAFTLLNHLITGCRMLTYQRKVVPAAHVIQLQPMNNNQSGASRANLEPTSLLPANLMTSSLVDHKTTTRTIGLTCTLGPFVVVPMYFWNGLIADVFRFSFLSFTVLFLPVSMYVGKKHLRVTVWREVKSIMHW